MTREDVLRELELLPVWQLRTPIVVRESIAVSVESELTILDNPEGQEKAEALNIVEVEVDEATLASPFVLPNFRYLTCEDGDWLFVLADAEPSVEQQHLLENIFKAMQLKMKPAQLSKSIADLIGATPPKILVSMGETTAQALLRCSESLGDLRGKPQQYEGIALIATYDTTHLLNNLSDKAKAWADLRLAMKVMQDLNN